MVTEKDKRRIRFIAEAMDELNRDAVQAAGRRSPGQNVETGLRLGDAALAIRQRADDRPPPVALTQVRRTRRVAEDPKR